MTDDITLLARRLSAIAAISFVFLASFFIVSVKNHPHSTNIHDNPNLRPLTMNHFHLQLPSPPIQNKHFKIPPNTNLAGRLLSACVCAYGINPAGEFTPAERYFAASGFKNAFIHPVVIQHGIGGTHAALVATTVDGVIVAFRGTLSFNRGIYSGLVDLVEDGFALPRKIWGKYSLPGRVHAGVLHSVLSLWERSWWEWFFTFDTKGGSIRYLKTEVKRQLQQSRSRNLYITGHSKGGAMASVAAMLFEKDEFFPTPVVYSFASLKPGNRDFRLAYEQKIKQFSYENYLDAVPFLPPTGIEFHVLKREIDRNGDNSTDPTIRKILLLLHKTQNNFETVGERFYMTKNRTSIPISSSNNNTTISRLDQLRLQEIAAEITKKNFSGMYAVHKPSCKPGAYMHGVCEMMCLNY